MCTYSRLRRSRGPASGKLSVGGVVRMVVGGMAGALVVSGPAPLASLQRFEGSYSSDGRTAQKEWDS